jgi:transposase InsO family protein
MLGLEPKNTAVRSPESNGIAESFVKTIERDYISIMPKPDGLTAAKNLAEAFEHYNEWHPHSALGYRRHGISAGSGPVMVKRITGVWKYRGKSMLTLV